MSAREQNPEPGLPCCGLPERDHCKDALSLSEAVVRVSELAHLGYTESIVVNDLRERVEKLEAELRVLRTAVGFRVQT